MITIQPPPSHFVNEHAMVTPATFCGVDYAGETLRLLGGKTEEVYLRLSTFRFLN